MGEDLTTGQTVSGQTQYKEADNDERISSVLSDKELTELTKQYLMGTMYLKLQNQMDSLGLSIASEKKEDEENSLL